MEKKGQIEGLQTIIISLVVIGIILGIGLLVIEEFKGTLPTSTKSVVNETITVTSSGTYVAQRGDNCFSGLSVTNMTNATTKVWINPSNYSVTDDGKITNLTSEYAPNTWRVSYDYKEGGIGCSGVNKTITAINKIPTWLSIIVILAIVGILLAIVFSVLPSGGGGSFSFRGGSGAVAEI